MKNNLNKGVKVKLVKFVVKLGLALGIVALVFNACSDKTTQKKLEFLNNLGESKLSFSENEKIERIKAFYREKLHNIEDLKIDFVEKIKANGDLEFDAYVFDFSVNGESQKEILFVKDNFFFSDFASMETLSTSKEKAIKILEKEANARIIGALEEDKDFIITLGSGKKEEFIFSDPLCSFCKEHLAKIDNSYLKSHTLHFIFVSVHGEAGFDRANLIYENIQKAQNDIEKLEIIKNYYEDNINQEALFAQKSLDLKILFDKYANLGLKYVPYIIEK